MCMVRTAQDFVASLTGCCFRAFPLTGGDIGAARLAREAATGLCVDSIFKELPRILCSREFCSPERLPHHLGRLEACALGRVARSAIAARS